MATSVGGVKNTALQKLVDGLIASIVRKDGTAPDAAPNAFKDRNEKQVSTTSVSEVLIEFKVNQDGNSAWCRVTPVNNTNGADSIQGNVDLTVLATKLA